MLYTSFSLCLIGQNPHLQAAAVSAIKAIRSTKFYKSHTNGRCTMQAGDNL